MSTLSPQIRVIALGLIRQGDRIWVADGQDPVSQRTFYRALGGGVEFGEHSIDALQREFREEIQAELTNIRYLGCIENLFIFDGRPHHEIVQLYEADFADRHFYQRESMQFIDDTYTGTAAWIPCDRFHSGELRLVPEICLTYL